MRARILLLFSIVCVGACMAGDDFRFYVTDQFSEPNLHYSATQDITIYTFEQQEPRLVFGKGQAVDGIKQDSYSFTSESYAGDLTEDDYEAFLKQIRLLPLRPLISAKGEYGETHGWLNLDGKEHIIKAAPESDVRKQWQAALDRLIEKHAEKAKIEKTVHNIEGEIIAPKDVDFPTILANPAKFDGKRLRISGFYHREFECSSFAPTEAGTRDFETAIWLGGISSLVGDANLLDPNDSFVVVEGTFEAGGGGHMGLWKGELVRITSATRQRKRPAEQTPEDLTQEEK